MICPPTLRPGAKVMLIGEAAGATEIEKQEGFVGSAGRVENRILASAGLRREDCSLNNVVKEQPPGNDFGIFYADKSRTIPTDNLLAYYRTLKAELTGKARPNVAVAIGDEALRALTGLQGITKYRGSILESSLVPGLKVIPALHPAWILRGQFKHFWINVADMQRVKREAAFPQVRYPKWASLVNLPAKQTISLLDSITFADRWAIDIETRGGHIACFSVASGGSIGKPLWALCVPLETTTGSNYFPDDEAATWLALQRLFARCPDLVGQNITFDLEWLFDSGLEPSGIFMDTMIAARVLNPEFPAGLAFLASMYTDMPYWKDDGKTWGFKQPDKQLWEYNNKDSVATLLASFEIEKQLRFRGLWDLYAGHVNKELGIALEMQRTRLPINADNLKLLKGFCDEALASSRQRWEAGDKASVPFPKDLNVNSPKQVAEFLYGTLGLKPKYKRGSVGPSADENAIMELRAENIGLEPLRWIMEERHLRKLKSSYLEAELDEDGRLPGNWCVCGTETGRWSSGKSPRGRGLNIQTIPKSIRHAVVPPPGSIFISPDLSQAEARVVAYLAGCQGLIDLFNDSTKNIHMENGLAIFGHYPIQDSPDYVLAKQCIHAANYRMTAKRFSVEAGIELAKASQILEAYHMRYPEIRRWHMAIRDDILKNGFLHTTFGRERLFYQARAEVLLTGKLSNEAWKDAISYIPQATVPDVTNKGMLEVWENLDYLRLHAQTHDGFLASIPIAKLGEAADFIKKSLTIPINIGERTLTIPVEISAGYSWGLLKKWTGERILELEEWQKWVAAKHPVSELKANLLHTK